MPIDIAPITPATTIDQNAPALTQANPFPLPPDPDNAPLDPDLNQMTQALAARGVFASDPDLKQMRDALGARGVIINPNDPYSDSDKRVQAAAGYVQKAYNQAQQGLSDINSAFAGYQGQVQAARAAGIIPKTGLDPTMINNQLQIPRKSGPAAAPPASGGGIAAEAPEGGSVLDNTLTDIGHFTQSLPSVGKAALGVIGNIASGGYHAAAGTIDELTGNYAGSQAHAAAATRINRQQLTTLRALGGADPNGHGGVIADLATAMGTAAGGDTQTAQAMLGQIGRNVAQYTHDHPFNQALNAAAILLPAARLGALKSISALSRAADMAADAGNVAKATQLRTMAQAAQMAVHIVDTPARLAGKVAAKAGQSLLTDPITGKVLRPVTTAAQKVGMAAGTLNKAPLSPRAAIRAGMEFKPTVLGEGAPPPSTPGYNPSRFSAYLDGGAPPEPGAAPPPAPTGDRFNFLEPNEAEAPPTETPAETPAAPAAAPEPVPAPSGPATPTPEPFAPEVINGLKTEVEAYADVPGTTAKQHVQALEETISQMEAANAKAAEGANNVGAATAAAGAANIGNVGSSTGTSAVNTATGLGAATAQTNAGGTSNGTTGNNVPGNPQAQNGNGNTATAKVGSAENRTDASRTNVSPQGFISDYQHERDRQFADYRDALQGAGTTLTPQAMTVLKAKVDENTKPFIDPNTQLLSNVTLDRTLDRAAAHVQATSEPAHYFEADIMNLGGLNPALGPDNADHVMRQLADYMQGEISHLGGHLSFYKVKGDELGGVIVGPSTEAVQKALADAKQKADDWIKNTSIEGQPLSKVPHSKKGKAPGTGFVYGVTPILPGMTAKSVRETGGNLAEHAKVAEQARLKPPKEKGLSLSTLPESAASTEVAPVTSKVEPAGATKTTSAVSEQAAEVKPAETKTETANETAALTIEEKEDISLLSFLSRSTRAKDRTLSALTARGVKDAQIQRLMRLGYILRTSSPLKYEISQGGRKYLAELVARLQAEGAAETPKASRNKKTVGTGLITEQYAKFTASNGVTYDDLRWNPDDPSAKISATRLGTGPGAPHQRVTWPNQQAFEEATGFSPAYNEAGETPKEAVNVTTESKPAGGTASSAAAEPNAVRADGTKTLAAEPSENVRTVEAERLAPKQLTVSTGESEGSGQSATGPGAKSARSGGESAATVPAPAEREANAKPGGRSTSTRQSADAGTANRNAVPEVKNTGEPLTLTADGSLEEDVPSNFASGHIAVNYHVTSPDTIGRGTQNGKLRDLGNAINTLKKIEKEGRMATPEEQVILAHFPGWGWTANLLHPDNAVPAARNHREYRSLTEFLTPAELKAARAATRNSHYTSPEIIQAMWDAMRLMGYAGGQVLEPSAGNGLFFGMMPEDMMAGSAVRGVEMDSVTGRILGQLVQKGRVDVGPFEKQRNPSDFYDLVISNVPFGNYGVNDPIFNQTHPDANLLSSRIHNYFFAKALDVARPGGVVAFITTHGTLDATDNVGIATRQFMAAHSDFLGAVRLPNTAFKGNAGTEVTTDIIFLQKKGTEANTASQPFQKMVDVVTPTGTATINEYFANNPGQVLGTHAMNGSMRYGKGKAGGEYTVHPHPVNDFVPIADRTTLGQDVAAALSRVAANGQYLPYTGKRGTYAPPQSLRRPGSLELSNGQVIIHTPSGPEVLNAEPKVEAVIRSYVPLRDSLMKIIADQTAGVDDATLTADQKDLRAKYDAYKKAHGILHGRSKTAWVDDNEAANVLALEKYNAKDKTVTLADIFTKRVVTGAPPAVKASSPQDALTISIREKGKMDLARMSDLLGMDPPAVTRELAAQGLIFHNPSGGWEIRDEYGSGNVRAKLAEARKAAERDPGYSSNIDYLESVQPRALSPAEISGKLGAQWIPADVYDAFLVHMIGGRADDRQVFYAPFGAKWDIPKPTNAHNSNSVNKWGTKYYAAHELMEMSMNSKSPEVTSKDKDGNRIVLVDETLLAEEKQMLIRAEWDSWLMADPTRATRLTDLYNAQVNVYRKRQHDGSILTEFPGQSPLADTLRPHQKNAVLRQVQTRDTLLAHEVGTGKTLVMITAAMEMRRMGLRRKPMMAVPKAVLAQTERAFRQTYPNAKLLVGDVDAATRQEFMASVATGDYDCILVHHDALKLLPVHPDTAIRHIEAQIEEMENFLNNAGSEGRRTFTVKETQTSLGKLRTKLEAEKERLAAKQDTNIYWDDLGIDHIFVDEAQVYKNLKVTSSREGFAADGSDMANDLFMKIGELHRNGGGVTFATGTPITNSIAELHTILRFLAPEILAEQGLSHFDAWAQQYADMENVLEQDTVGKFRRKARLVKFSNLPELMQLYNSVADAVMAQDVPGLKRPDLINDKGEVTHAPIIVENVPNPAQMAYYKELVERAKHLPTRREAMEIKQAGGTPDGMLKCSSDARKATLDDRLSMPGSPDYFDSSVNQVVDKVFENWDATKADRRTQLVFVDLGVPNDKKEFNLYDDMIRKLVARGVPKSEIATIYQPKDDAAKLALFDKVNSGEVRIMFGSRAKMGVGVNVQKRLLAIHQVDPTWRPDQMEQADGRIIRTGNLFADQGVKIYQYITKDSFDAFMWQKIATKAGFISQVTRGDVEQREAEDLGMEQSFSFAQLASVASGNPHIIELVKVSDQVKHLTTLRRAHQAQLIELHNDYRRVMEVTIPGYERNIKRLTGLLEYAEANAPDKFTISIQDKDFDNRNEAGQALAGIASRIERWDSDKAVGKYGGWTIRTGFASINGKTDKGTYGWIDGAKISLKAPGAEDQFEFKFDPKDYEKTGTGLIQKIENLIGSVQNRIDRAETGLANAKSEAPKIEEQSRRPFAREQDLRDAQTRQNTLEALVGMDINDESDAGWGSRLGRVEGTPEQTLDGDVSTTGTALPTAENAQQQANAAEEGTQSETEALAPQAKMSLPSNHRKFLRDGPSDAFMVGTYKGERVAGHTGMFLIGEPDIAKSIENEGKDYHNITEANITRLMDQAKDRETEPISLGQVMQYKGKPSFVIATGQATGDKYYINKSYLDAVMSLGYSVRAAITPAKKQPQASQVVDATGNLRGVLMLIDGSVSGSYVHLATDIGLYNPPKQIREQQSSQAETGDYPPGSTLNAFVNPMHVYNAVKTIYLRTAEGIGGSQHVLAAKDVFLGNLSILEKRATPGTFLRARELAGASGKVSVAMGAAASEITHLLGDDPAKWQLFLHALAESRLRGIRQRWAQMATDVHNAQDDDLITEIIRKGVTSYALSDTYDFPTSMLSANEGFRGVAKEARGYAENNDVGSLRKLLLDGYTRAAAAVPHIGGLDTPAALAGVMKLPGFDAALQVYKDAIESELSSSHSSNEGVFSNALGPLDTYYPLVPLNEDGEPIGGSAGSRAEFASPGNANNRFATGQAKDYAVTTEDLRRSMHRAFRRNAQAALMSSLAADGLLKAQDDPGVSLDKDTHQVTMTYRGKSYPARLVPVSTDRIIVRKGEAPIFLPGKQMVAPQWLVKELGPMLHSTLPEWGGGARALPGAAALSALNTVGLAGPLDAIFHTQNLLGTLVSEIPYLRTGKGALLDVSVNNALLKMPGAIAALIYTDATSEANMGNLREMARLGLVPPRYGSVTMNRAVAENTGAELVGKDLKTVIKGGHLEAALFGAGGLDIRARIIMYRAAKMMVNLDPDKPLATNTDGSFKDEKQAIELSDFVQRLSEYNRALESDVVRFVKDTKLAPFASAGAAMLRNGVRYWLRAADVTSLPGGKDGRSSSPNSGNGSGSGNNGGGNNPAAGTPGKAPLIPKRVANKLAQQLTGGALARVILWVTVCKIITDLWPWQDRKSRFLQWPVPDSIRTSRFGQDIWGTGDDQAYISSGGLDPIGYRGASALGLRGYYDTRAEGGSRGQAQEAAITGGLNAGMHPFVSGPAFNALFQMSFHDPYITALRDPTTGKPSLQIKTIDERFPTGIAGYAKALPGTMIAAVNPSFGTALGAVGVGPKAQQMKRLSTEGRTVKTIVDLAFPRLLGGTGDATAQGQRLMRGERVADAQDIDLDTALQSTLMGKGVSVGALTPAGGESAADYEHRRQRVAETLGRVLPRILSNLKSRPEPVQKQVLSREIADIKRRIKPRTPGYSPGRALNALKDKAFLP